MTKQEITNLEAKAKNIQSIIDNYREKLSKYEITLLALIEEINQLKIKTKYENKKQ